MTEYPATSRAFKIGTKKFEMKMLTIGLQAKIEDENIEVTRRDIIIDCTNLKEEDLDNLRIDQFQSIYDDTVAFCYSKENNEVGESKKP